MLAELFIGQWLLRLSQRVMRGDDEDLRLLVEEIAVERMAIAGAVADHDGRCWLSCLLASGSFA